MTATIGNWGGNWGGNLTFTAADHAAPATVAELQELVARTPQLRALGTRHSFSTVADTTGTLVSTRRLELPIEIDERARVAVVPGGSTYAEVSTELHRHGWALHNMGSLPHISVAGACATGTHGSGNLLGNLATAVVAVELVRADGELVRCERGEPDFPGSVLALGCLGVVTRLWLRLEPAYDVSQEVFTDTAMTRVVERIQEILAAAYSVSVFSSFRDQQSVEMIWFKSRLDATLVEADPAALVGGSAAQEDLHPVVGFDPSAATPQRGMPGPWHERLPHFRSGFTPSAGHEIQSEFLLPRGVAGQVLDALNAIAPGFAPALQVFEMRTVAADDLWLSPSHERDSVAAHFTWHPSRELVAPALELVQVALAPFDPRPHWGKVFTGWDTGRVQAAYPGLPQFRDLRNRLDPERHFGNDFVVGLLGH
jgi:xylitol oxidase